MKRLYTADNSMQAQLMADELINLGIPVVIFNQHSAGGLGDLPASYPELWLKRDQDEARALRFVTSFEQKLITDNEIQTQCHACGEHNPKQFDFCWACQQELTPSSSNNAHA